MKPLVVGSLDTRQTLVESKGSLISVVVHSRTSGINVTPPRTHYLRGRKSRGVEGKHRFESSCVKGLAVGDVDVVRATRRDET